MTTQETYLAEICRKLRAYINTGIPGFWTQAIDRLRAANIKTDGWEASKEAAEELLGHIHAHYTIR